MSRLKLITMAPFLLILLQACGGGDEGGQAAPTTGSGSSDPVNPVLVPSPREDNLNIPAEHSGIIQHNTRLYRLNSEGYKVIAEVSGLNGQVALGLGDEILLIDKNGEKFFESTFVAETNVTLNIEAQPFLQTCSFSNGVNTGVVRSDTSLRIYLTCVDSNNPTAPFISSLYSASTNTIDISWDASIDRDDTSDHISYRVYWSKVLSEVENKTAASIAVMAGDQSMQITGLDIGGLYYLAVEAIDQNNNSSPLSEIRALQTLSSPNTPTGTVYYTLDSDDISISADGNIWTIPASVFNSIPAAGTVLLSELDLSFEIVKIISVELDAGNYVMEVEPSDILDIFQTFSISSDVGRRIVSPEKKKGVVQSAHSKSQTNVQLSAIKATICRNSNSTLTLEQLDQIEIIPIHEFEPRVISNFHIDKLDPLDPIKIANIEFQGKIVLGLKVGLELVTQLYGEYICELKGFPIDSPTWRYTLPGTPPILVVQDFSVDAKIKLNLNAQTGIDNSALYKVTAILSGRLFYNPSTGAWESDVVPSLAHNYDYKLDYGANAITRAAVIPEITTTLYKSASVTLGADAGVKTRVSTKALSVNDPIAEFRSLDFLLDEFSSDADFKLQLSANLSFLGLDLYTVKAEEIYSSQAWRIFDTPSICINATTDKKNCETFKKVSRLDDQNRYELEIYLIDGTNNKAKISNIEWQISPKNGFMEVNKINPRKATVETFDDLSYTVVASVDGILGDISRKYVTFSIGGQCQYGLGHELPKEYEQYFRGPGEGFFFPVGVSPIDREHDYSEVCQFGQASDVNSYTFYGGQKNGMAEIFDNGGKRIQYYENGVLISDDYVTGGLKSHAQFTPMLVPDTEYMTPVVTYHVSNDLQTGQRVTEEILDFSGHTAVYIGYYENGNIYNISSNEFVEAFIKQGDWPSEAGSFVNVSIDATKELFYTQFYADGQLHYHEDYVTGSSVTCGWYNPDPEGSPQMYEFPYQDWIYGCGPST